MRPEEGLECYRLPSYQADSIASEDKPVSQNCGEEKTLETTAECHGLIIIIITLPCVTENEISQLFQLYSLMQVDLNVSRFKLCATSVVLMKAVTL